MTARANRFLVPVDDSEGSAAALDVAARLARDLGGTLTLLAIAPLATPPATPLTAVPPVGGGEAEEELQQLLDLQAQERLDELMARVGEGVDVSGELTWAPLGPAVVERAERGDHDFVVIAWPDRGALGHLLHDHAALHVLDHCRLPALAVPSA